MKTGILIANTGSPASPTSDDVEAYLSEYLMDPHIMQMPRIAWHYLVFHKILPKRKFTTAERYRSIWTPAGSPLVANQAQLCNRIQTLFDAGDMNEDTTYVRSAMSYGEPSIPSVLWELRDLGCERIVCMPLYPQSAYCITESVRDAFDRALAELEWDIPHTFVDNYSDSPAYLTCLAGKIKDAGFGREENDRLLCSYHAVPLKDVKAGDTYCKQTARTTASLAEMLEIPQGKFFTSYQSAFGNPKRWAQPPTRELLHELAQEPGRLFLCCPGFALDCLETLYDIPAELEPAFEKDSLTSGRLVWVRALGPSKNHAQAIYGTLTEYLLHRISKGAPKAPAQE